MKKTIRAKQNKMSVSFTPSSYDTDFYKWTRTQASLLKKGDFDQLDIKHLREEIESMGNSEQSKLESYLIVLLLHLLKIKYQPTIKTRSWDLSVKHATHKAQKVLEKNPSLKHKLAETFEEAYYTAKYEAAKETGLDENIFPEVSEWKVSDLLKIKK